MADIVVKGTTFDTDAVSGDVFFRTDLGLWCYYDGTRWLTQQKFVETFVGSSAASIYRRTHANYQPYVERFYISTYTATTNDGSNYWVVSFKSTSSVFVPSGTLSTITTIADTADTWTEHDEDAETNTDGTYGGVEISFAATGSPGACTAYGFIEYRLIIT